MAGKNCTRDQIRAHVTFKVTIGITAKPNENKFVYALVNSFANGYGFLAQRSKLFQSESYSNTRIREVKKE